MSTASELMTKFARASADRPVELQRNKRDGKKIVEFVGNFVPEEMIHAAGAESYLLCRGGEPEAPDAVLGDILRYMNPLARSMAGFYRLGLDPVTPIADVIALSQYECHVERIAEYLEILGLPIQQVGVAADWTREFAREYYYNELVDLKQKLEDLTGNVITDENLCESAKLYNKINQMLRKIADLMKLDNPPLSGTDFIKLNHYSFFTRPEVALEHLEQIYAALLDAPGKFSNDSPRILIAGHAVAAGDYVAVAKIEEMGAVIAAQMLEEGIRWYQWDTALEGDMIRNIWKQRYVDKIPVNVFQPAWKERFEYMKQLIKDYRIDGVIWYQLLYDEIFDMEYTVLSKWLSEINVPLQRIETSYEYTREAMMPLTTRIESFVELLKGGR